MTDVAGLRNGRGLETNPATLFVQDAMRAIFRVG